jgi:enoyl-[acyl-carrier protein] reductase I
LRSLGAKVAFSYRQRTEQNAQDPLGVEIDFDDEEAIESGMADLERRLGRLDFLVHTLVTVPEGALGRPLLALTKEEFSQAMEGGAYSLVRALRHALPLLERSSAPRVVTLLSAGSDFAIPNYHAVGMAKAALAASLRYLAHELGPKGVLCNGVSFSIIDTEAAEHALGEDVTRRSRDYLVKRSMTGRAVSYADVNSAIAYLCSRHCQNMTGEVINVDGGYTRNYF